MSPNTSVLTAAAVVLKDKQIVAQLGGPVLPHDQAQTLPMQFGPAQLVPTQSLSSQSQTSWFAAAASPAVTLRDASLDPLHRGSGSLPVIDLPFMQRNVGDVQQIPSAFSTQRETPGTASGGLQAVAYKLMVCRMMSLRHAGREIRNHHLLL